MKKKFQPAISGLILVLKESSILILLFFAFMALLVAWFLKFDYIELLIILGFIGLVISIEIINSAIEELCDLVENSNNPKIGKIKDISAGAVLWSSFIAFIVGILIILKHL